MSRFRLSQISYRNLEGVHPKLVTLVELAITRTPIDFRVVEGLRTIERQRELVRMGASMTLDSNHLTGRAVDLVPWVGSPRWEWPLIYPLADCIRSCAKELDISLRWGGAWDVIQFTHTIQDPKDLMEAYGARRRAEGRRPFFDGPHYELSKKEK